MPQVQQLFQTMSTGGYFGADEIKTFDGRLFDNATVFELDTDSLDILRRVSTLDWANIEPSIFGTLFVRSLDPSKRSQLGAQYTSKDDIQLILEPVLMAPLRRKWTEIQKQARDLAAQRKAATGAKRAKLDRQLRDLLIGFATELATISVLDPACGSGNFLYLALVLLLDLVERSVQLYGRVGLSTVDAHARRVAVAAAIARHREGYLRTRTGADHHLDRLHSVVHPKRFRLPARTDFDNRSIR